MKTITMDFETYEKELSDRGIKRYHEGFEDGQGNIIELFICINKGIAPEEWWDIKESKLQFICKMLGQDFEELKKKWEEDFEGCQKTPFEKPNESGV